MKDNLFFEGFILRDKKEYTSFEIVEGEQQLLDFKK